MASSVTCACKYSTWPPSLSWAFVSRSSIMIARHVIMIFIQSWTAWTRCSLHRPKPRICEAKSSRGSHGSLHWSWIVRCNSRHPSVPNTWFQRADLQYGLRLAAGFRCALHRRRLTLVRILRRLSSRSFIPFTIHVGLLMVSESYSSFISANRIPEKLAPGSFDYFLASHQIFHVCVVLAAWAHYRGLLTCLHYRMSRSSCV